MRAAVLIPSFANPTGSLMTEARKRDCVAVLYKHKVALVEDDLYGELSFDHRQVPPMAAFCRLDASSFLASSLSKTLLPGARVGYLVARSPLIERAIAHKQATTLANATLSVHVAQACLGSGLFDRHLRKLLPALEANLRRMQDGVMRHFPAGTRISRPSGGFLLWVELPAGCDGLELFRAARERGISVAPGSIFTLAGGLDRFVRLNGGAGGDLDGAIQTLGELASVQLRAAKHMPGPRRTRA